MGHVERMENVKLFKSFSLGTSEDDVYLMDENVDEGSY